MMVDFSNAQTVSFVKEFVCSLSAAVGTNRLLKRTLQDMDYIKTEERCFTCCLTSSDNSATSQSHLLNVLQRTYRQRMCRVVRMELRVEIMLHLQEQHVHTTKRSSCLQQCRKLVRLEQARLIFFFSFHGLELHRRCQSSSRMPSEFKVRNRIHLKRNHTTLCQ